MTKTCTEQDQAAVYSALLGACLANAPHCDSFMTWGFTDAYTWLPGRSPLMFDEQYQPKPAYFALQKLLASPPPPPLPFCIEHNCQGTVEVHYNTPIPELGCTLSGWASYGCNLTGYCGPSSQAKKLRLGLCSACKLNLEWSAGDDRRKGA